MNKSLLGIFGPEDFDLGDLDNSPFFEIADILVMLLKHTLDASNGLFSFTLIRHNAWFHKIDGLSLSVLTIEVGHFSIPHFYQFPSKLSVYLIHLVLLLFLPLRLYVYTAFKVLFFLSFSILTSFALFFLRSLRLVCLQERKDDLSGLVGLFLLLFLPHIQGISETD